MCMQFTGTLPTVSYAAAFGFAVLVLVPTASAEDRRSNSAPSVCVEIDGPVLKDGQDQTDTVRELTTNALLAKSVNAIVAAPVQGSPATGACALRYISSVTWKAPEFSAKETAIRVGTEAGFDMLRQKTGRLGGLFTGAAARAATKEVERLSQTLAFGVKADDAAQVTYRLISVADDQVIHSTANPFARIAAANGENLLGNLIVEVADDVASNVKRFRDAQR